MDFELAQRRRRGKIIPNRKPLSREVKKSISMLVVTLLFLIVMLSIVHLLNTTQSNQKGYTLQQEQLKKDRLMIEQRSLINKIIGAMSYHNIEESDLVQAMIKPENPHYIEE